MTGTLLDYIETVMATNRLSIVPSGISKRHRDVAYHWLLTILLMLPLLSAHPASHVADRNEADSLSRLYTGEPEAPLAFPGGADLNEILKIAVERSPALRAAYHDWQAEVKRSGYAGALPDPKLTYSYFVENVETRVGPQEQKFGLRQQFPWFGMLGARKSAAVEAANASFRKFESERLRLFYQVKASYYDYYFLGRELQLTKDNLELLGFWESVAQTRYKVGLKQHPDVIKVQVELGLLEDRKQTLEDLVAPTEASLRALLDLPDSIYLPLPDSVAVPEVELNTDTLLGAIRRSNPELNALAHIIKKEELGVKVASRQALPGFSVGVDYIQTGKAMDPGVASSGKDAWMVSAGMSLPIWFGKNDSRKEEARARQRSAKYQYLDKQNRLEAYGERLLFEYHDAMRKLRLYRDGLIPKAEQSLNTSFAAYRAGDIDLLSVLDAQRQLLDFQLIMERETVNLAKSRAELEMLIGHELDRTTP